MNYPKGDKMSKAEQKLKIHPYDLECWNILIKDAQVINQDSRDLRLSATKSQRFQTLISINFSGQSNRTVQEGLRETSRDVSNLWKVLEALHWGGTEE